jgi:hypothetical protein
MNCVLSKNVSILLILVSLFSAPALHAAQSSVPFFECRNCTDAQMQQAALARPGYGVRIVYNLNSGHIFKYNVYLEAGCLNRPQGDQKLASGGTHASCNQNPTRQIEWMPIDPAMLAPFAAMVEVHDTAPEMLLTAKVEVPIHLVCCDPTHPPLGYDPYAVAYDRGTGPTHQPFMDDVTRYVNTHTDLSDLHAPLASWFYDVLAPLYNMTISISQTPGLSLDLGTVMQNVTIDFVDFNGAFVRVDFIRRPNSTEYEGVFKGAWDASQVPLPTSTEVYTPGFHRDFFGYRGWESADALREFLHRRGWNNTGGPIPSGCHSMTLSCIVQPKEHRGCRIDCNT